VGRFLGQSDPVYVVQTNVEIVRRCLLMATDPGDLVLDPTCGSGTTAFVAEQWGRRWITIDTSRVAMALARSRIMGARYPFYLLADSREGQIKEGEVTHTAPSSQPTHGNIRQGFVYERVSRITLKSIANNAGIDVIWEQAQQVLEPLREKLNAALENDMARMGDSARVRHSLAGVCEGVARRLVGRRASRGRRRRLMARSQRRSSLSTSTTSPTRQKKGPRRWPLHRRESQSPSRTWRGR